MNNVHYALISYEGVQSQEHVRCSEGNEKRFYKTTGPEFKTFKSLIRYKKIGNRSYNIKINSRVGSPVEPHVEDASCCIDMNNIYYDLILYDSPLMKDRRNGVNRAGIPEKLPHRKYRTTVIR